MRNHTWMERGIVGLMANTRVAAEGSTPQEPGTRPPRREALGVS